jgi:hypothetical protein
VPVIPSRRKSCVYYPKYIRQALAYKKYLWRKRHCLPFKQQYYAHAKRCRKLIKQLHVRNESRLINNGLIKPFYNYVNSKIKSTSRIASLQDSKGNIHCDDVERADMFNKFFSSVFVTDNGNMPAFPNRTDKICADTVFPPDKVLKAIAHMNKSAAAGPDNLPAILFVKLASHLCVPLSLMYTWSYASGIVPDDWRNAIVVPIFKKGIASSCENYRPVSLTCIACKIMESIIRDSIIDHLKSCNLITQH